MTMGNLPLHLSRTQHYSLQTTTLWPLSLAHILLFSPSAYLTQDKNLAIPRLPGPGGISLAPSITYQAEDRKTKEGIRESRGSPSYLIILPLGEVDLERRQRELLANAPLVVDGLRLQRRVLTAVPEGSKATT